VVLSHPTGNSFVRGAIEGLESAGLLAEFYTSVATFPGNVWSMLSRTAVGREFGRRQYAEQVRPLTRQRPMRELGRMVANKAKLSRLTRHESGPFCVDAVYRDLDRHVAKQIRRCRCRAVYAYEDGALETFRAAKSLGIQSLYDLPIGYWRTARTLLGREQERWPEWAATMPGFKDSQAKLARKDEELQLADRIYVASQFTRSTLDDYPGKLAPVEVIPYGYPPPGAQRDYCGLGRRKLKLLYVGGLSQRKGIADVFAIAQALANEVELTIVGNGPVNECRPLSEALGRHRWIASLPHAQVLELMREHDVLLFPSLFEGFGLVITEAMSQGTPVITTDRTAGADLIEHGKNGWLIEAGDTEALRLQVEQVLNNVGSVAECGENARQCAARRPWSQYGQEIAASIRSAVEGTE
jgi:glycosyltransferase involved in cell wall biosynthesis